MSNEVRRRPGSCTCSSPNSRLVPAPEPGSRASALLSAHCAPEHGEFEILVTVEKQEHPAADMDGASNLVTLGEVTIRYVHSDASSPYSLLEWSAPPGTPSPPVHVHHPTDEGFYVTAGAYGFELDGERILTSVGSHVLVPKGRAHTF